MDAARNLVFLKIASLCAFHVCFQYKKPNCNAKNITKTGDKPCNVAGKTKKRSKTETLQRFHSLDGRGNVGFRWEWIPSTLAIQLPSLIALSGQPWGIFKLGICIRMMVARGRVVFIPLFGFTVCVCFFLPIFVISFSFSFFYFLLFLFFLFSSISFFLFFFLLCCYFLPFTSFNSSFPPFFFFSSSCFFLFSPYHSQLSSGECSGKECSGLFSTSHPSHLATSIESLSWES